MNSGHNRGPIIKNRTFFFFDYLGARNNLPTDIRTTVPSALVRAGNFSEFTGTRECGRNLPANASVGVLCDPRTGLPFAGNSVPNNRISPVAQAFFNAYTRCRLLQAS